MNQSLFVHIRHRALQNPLDTVLEVHSPATPDRPVLPLTWGAIEKETARFAAALRYLGLEKGDRVAVQVEKSPEALLLYLACSRAGVVFLPLNTAYQMEEIQHILSDAAPRLFVCTPSTAGQNAVFLEGFRQMSLLTLGADGSGSFKALAEGLEARDELTECDESSLAAILYTSGTTGRPKGAMLTHGNLVSNACALVKLWGFTQSDVLLHSLPLFHVHGLFVACHCALFSGARMLWMKKFDEAEVLRLLPQATVFMGVPTFYSRLLGLEELGREPCRNMRLFISGSAPLSAETFRTFQERTGHTILERYGMTEIGMQTSNPLLGERKAGTVGLPLPGSQVRISGEEGRILERGETGMIEVRGPNVFSGYWRRERSEEDFTQDGWFRTGDLGRLDGEGYLSIVGRAKELIISGGYNVYPREVEAVIERCPGVAEAAVFGLPDQDLGEAVTAAITLCPGKTLEAGTVTAFTRERLAHFKCPRRVHFMAELPRNAMGKVQKMALRARFLRKEIDPGP